jgi:hypothetical protein
VPTDRRKDANAMTIRSENAAGRKAPRIAKLALERETLSQLTDIEAEKVAGGQVFLPPQAWTTVCIVAPSNPSLQARGCSGA